MGFRREKIKDYFLLDTNVENMFINEYMAAAPGDFVKVYLFAQMYADLDTEISNEEIAKYLSLDYEDVLKAWTYWERTGVVRKIFKESGDKFDYDIEFVILKEQLYGEKETKKAFGSENNVQTAMADKDVQEMFSYAAKTLSDEGIVTYEAVWEVAVNVLNRRKILKKDELNVMYELSHFNSYIDKNMQVQNLELSIERLKRINENVAMDIAPRMKICRIGGITAGVFIAIMLI